MLTSRYRHALLQSSPGSGWSATSPAHIRVRVCEFLSSGGPALRLLIFTARRYGCMTLRVVFREDSRRLDNQPSCGLYDRAQGALSLLPSLLVRSPERQVVAEELHDERGVLVRVLCHVVQLRNGILEGGAGHFASLVRVRQDLVHEDRVVQGQAQADGVGHCQVLFSHRLRIRISPC